VRGGFVVYDKDTGEIYDRFATHEELEREGNKVAAQYPDKNLDGKHDPYQEVFDWRTIL
jgi:hypothetical protein